MLLIPFKSRIIITRWIDSAFDDDRTKNFHEFERTREFFDLKDAITAARKLLRTKQAWDNSVEIEIQKRAPGYGHIPVVQLKEEIFDVILGGFLHWDKSIPRRRYTHSGLETDMCHERISRIRGLSCVETF